MITPPTALLVDFDGVLRTFDPAVTAEIERAHGVEPGTVLAAALDHHFVLPALDGRATRADWLAGLTTTFGSELVDAFFAYRGELNADVLGLVRDVRAAGLKVALATNSMDDLDDVLAGFGLTGEFDAVASSWRLRVHKPAPGFFEGACELLGTPPKLCLLLDDDDRNIRGARAGKLSAYRYTPGDDLSYPRKALGLAARQNVPE